MGVDDSIRAGVVDMLLDDSKLVEEKQTPRPGAKVRPVVEDIEPAGDELLERLSDLAHSVWGHWMEYLFEKSPVNDNGEAVIPKGLVERWNKQIQTDYADLSEKEKESDREQARKVLAIIGKLRESGIKVTGAFTKKLKERGIKKTSTSSAIEQVLENQTRIDQQEVDPNCLQETIKRELCSKVNIDIFKGMFG